MEALRERLADLEGLIQGTREELSEYAGIEVATSRPRRAPQSSRPAGKAGRGTIEASGSAETQWW